MAKANFYAVKKGKKPGIYTSWEECEAQVKGFKGAEYKGFMEREEAEEYIAGVNSTADMTVVQKPSTKEEKSLFVRGSYIGSDEVGKIEPLKRLIAVAVHVKKDKFERIRELGVDDSKKIVSKIENIGKMLTGFDKFDDFESGKVYENYEYGLTYCPIILSNKEYNKYHDEGINANEVLTKIHNDANLSLLKYLKKQEQEITDIIIDDYMGGDGYNKFNKYLERLDDNNLVDEMITDVPALNISFETKADSTYKEIVGTASDICAYLDRLWQKYLNKKYGMQLDYSNNIQSGNLCESFEAILEKDPKMEDVKHTKTYDDWKK